jgi:serine/threonine protein kinase
MVKTKYFFVLIISIILLNLNRVTSLGCSNLQCFKYSISSCEKINQGGQGVIYKITTNGDPKFKVLKEMPWEQGKTMDDYLNRVKIYKEMMQSLPYYNKNIMRILDFEINQPSKVFCLIQEYIQGTNMDKYLREEVSTPKNMGWVGDKILQEDLKNKKALFFKLLHCMMDSISVLNGIYYYHIDVKGENFMVDVTQTCKLIDFDSTVHKDTNLEEADIAMTPSYVAPEVVRYFINLLCKKDQTDICKSKYFKDDWIISQDMFRGQSLYNSDSFAIGIILYQTLFNKQNPFYSQNALDVYCRKSAWFFECLNDFLADKYFSISKGLYDKDFYNYEEVKHIEGKPTISDDFYDFMFKNYQANGNGRYNIDFTQSELNGLFYIMSRLLEMNPDQRLTMSQAKYLFEKIVLNSK